MVTTASHVGRLMHRHEIERDDLESELAQEESRLRAEIDQDRQDLRDLAKRQANTPPSHAGRAPVRVPDDEAHARTRAAAIQTLYGKHDVRRKAMRDRQNREIEAARKIAPTAAKHKPPDLPEKHHPTAVIWPDLDGARRQAVHGVYQRYAMLHDNADADQIAQVKKAGRYMQPGSRMTNDAHDRLEGSHLELCRKEFRELEGLAAKFRGDIEAERRRLAEQARERSDLQARHAAQSAAHR
jgi:hypothetical protein